MRRFLTILVCVVVACSTIVERTGAVTVTPTPEAEFANTAPLLITAYQTANVGKQLIALEVYNQSDDPVALTEWNLYAITQDTRYQLAMSTLYNGLLLPGEHVTASVAAGASYTLQGVIGGTITSIEVECNDVSKNYKAVIATIKEPNDAPFFRSYTSTGYSTAAQPFVTSPNRSFYDDGLYSPLQTSLNLRIIEIYPYALDCAPNNSSELCGDYVKLKNTGEVTLQLDGLALRTDYYGATSTSSNTIKLYGSVAPGNTVLVTTLNSGSPMQLTNGGGYVWLEDAWGLARYDDTMQQYEPATSSMQGYSYAFSGDTWQWTTTPSPHGDNIVTPPSSEAAACSEGKYRNPETGRCRTIEEAVNALTECEEGYERNPATNRCRKIVLASETSLAPCKEGQERNPATNRCRSIASAVAELLPCDEGYERNPETNRCRKLKTSDVPAADFPVTPTAAVGADMSGWYAFGALGVVALSYAVWEWRVEIKAIATRLLGFLRRAK